MRITIETIAHKDQRYPTVGDWQWDASGNLKISVSDMGDWRYEALVALHELAEVLICKHDGVNQADVDRFDMDYEEHRMEGDDSEPGDSPEAPYNRQHCIATGIERIMAAELGVGWKAYDDTVMSLP